MNRGKHKWSQRSDPGSSRREGTTGRALTGEEESLVSTGGSRVRPLVGEPTVTLIVPLRVKNKDLRRNGWGRKDVTGVGSSRFENHLRTSSTRSDWK